MLRMDTQTLFARIREYRRINRQTSLKYRNSSLLEYAKKMRTPTSNRTVDVSKSQQRINKANDL